MQDKHIVMCVGFTHSGKTTFSKELEKEIAGSVLIDSDAIAEFAKNNYESLFTSEYNRSKKNLDDPNLKFSIYKTVLDFALQAKTKAVILSNGNLANDMRDYITSKAKEHSYKVITAYFNLPMDIIEGRIKSSSKSTDVFTLKKTWGNILTQQKGYAELPPMKGTDYYFEITDEKSREVVFKGIVDILSI